MEHEVRSQIVGPVGLAKLRISRVQWMVWAQEVIQRSFGDQNDVASRRLFHVFQTTPPSVAHLIVASPKTPYYTLRYRILYIASAFYH
jgi:hypothetical protein